MWISKASRTEGTRFARFASKWFDFHPAVNIEHRTGRLSCRYESLLADYGATERTNAFVSLIFGYSVLTILYQSRAKVRLVAHGVFRKA